MKRCHSLLLPLTAIFLLAAFTAASWAADARVFRVAYIEGSPFWAFPEIMNATRKALEEMGWKDRIIFPEADHFSPALDASTQETLHTYAKDLMARSDIDMIISAGTPATAAVLKFNNKKTPVVAIGVSDPLKSQFVISQDDSGVDNFTARIVPERYQRMFEIFHDVVGFKKLGLIYTDTENGRKYTNLDDARVVAGKKGFEIITYTKIQDSSKADDCLAGLKWLVENGMDAFFIPATNCFDWSQSDVKILMDYLIANEIPTFAREGTKYVKSGALMGFSSIDWTARGKYVANKIVEIFEGASPRSLKMVDPGIPKITLNIQVAEKIGFDPPFDIIAASDEIYDTITVPEK